MWITELALTTLWMAGIALGLTLGGLIHVLALVVLALVFFEDTPVERAIRTRLAHRRSIASPKVRAVS